MSYEHYYKAVIKIMKDNKKDSKGLFITYAPILTHLLGVITFSSNYFDYKSH